MTTLYLFSSDSDRDRYCSQHPKMLDDAVAIQRNQIVYADGDVSLFFVVSGPVPDVAIDLVINLTT